MVSPQARGQAFPLTRRKRPARQRQLHSERTLNEGSYPSVWLSNRHAPVYTGDYQQVFWLAYRCPARADQRCP
jgi:hypothetical protein